MAEARRRSRGRLDSCFANAAVAGGQANPPFVESTLEQWRAVTRVNLDGVYLTLREAARHMIDQGTGGSLVGILHHLGIEFGSPREQAYAASKAGVVAIVKALAVELGKHNIRANALLPGWTISPRRSPGPGLLAPAYPPRRPDPAQAMGHSRRMGRHRRLPRLRRLGVPHR